MSDEPRVDWPGALTSLGCLLILAPVVFLLAVWVWQAVKVIVF